jgi:hypothetical protein
VLLELKVLLSERAVLQLNWQHYTVWEAKRSELVTERRLERDNSLSVTCQNTGLGTDLNPTLPSG